MTNDHTSNLWDNLHSAPQIEKPKQDTTYRKIYVNFLSESHIQEYAQLIGRNIGSKTKELWFPEHEENIDQLFEWSETGYYEESVSRNKKTEYQLDDDLFEYETDPLFYELHWQNMPEFDQPDASAVRKIVHYFKTEDDVESFARLINHSLTKQTSSIWFPQREKNNMRELYWISQS